jgi:hypothetical protein
VQPCCWAHRRGAGRRRVGFQAGVPSGVGAQATEDRR